MKGESAGVENRDLFTRKTPIRAKKRMTTNGGETRNE